MRLWLKRAGIALVGLAMLAIASSFALAAIGRSRLAGPHEVSHSLPPSAIAAASVVMGAKIAVSRGCTDCHSEGMRGKVFADIPPGFFVAPNLTKGLGGIGARYATADDWDHAFRFGVRPDGSIINRMMPSWFFNRLSNEDAASLAAYLSALPPIDNELPATTLRRPAYVEAGMPGNSPADRLRELQQPRTRPAPGPTAEYGRYIASTACVGCHSETMLGGPHHDPAGKPAPGLSHVGQWTLDEFKRTLRTGVAPPERQLTHWMPWVKFTSFNDEELTALHEYLKTVRAVLPSG